MNIIEVLKDEINKSFQVVERNTHKMEGNEQTPNEIQKELRKHKPKKEETTKTVQDLKMEIETVKRTQHKGLLK